uniref:Dual specificity protein phosphatase 15 n=1 Tax=Dromaius novaehollandiae TaxID=8790 RepID=A0A8C4JF31_DRONO
AGSGAHARLPLADAEDRETLLRSGVTHILAVHSNAKPVLEGMTYLCISASDSSSQNLMQHFKECIKFIHECRLRGGGCLVHCLAGVSRSTTVLVAYLMTVTELSWEGCLAATRAVRSYVSPNCGFQQQLQEYEATLLTEVGPARLRASSHVRAAAGTRCRRMGLGLASRSPFIRDCGACEPARLLCMQLAAGPRCLRALASARAIYYLGVLLFACVHACKKRKKKCRDITRVHLNRLSENPALLFSREFNEDAVGGRREHQSRPGSQGKGDGRMQGMPRASHGAASRSRSVCWDEMVQGPCKPGILDGTCIGQDFTCKKIPCF